MDTLKNLFVGGCSFIVLLFMITGGRYLFDGVVSPDWGYLIGCVIGIPVAAIVFERLARWIKHK